MISYTELRHAFLSHAELKCTMRYDTMVFGFRFRALGLAD